MQELDCANLIIDTLKLDISPEAFLEKAHALDAKEMSNVTLMPGDYYNIMFKNLT